jgi:NACalpha-BTF3-like transcription factor
MNMAVSLELIEILRERANISYEEAKEALEKCNNDVVEALIYLEKQDKI